MSVSSAVAASRARVTDDDDDDVVNFFTFSLSTLSRRCEKRMNPCKGLTLTTHCDALRTNERDENDENDENDGN